MAVSAMLILMISRLIWEKQDALFVSYIWLTYPFLLWFINQPYPEMPYFVASFSTVYVFLLSYRQNTRKYWVYGVIVGVLSAVAMMIKPVGIGVPIIVILIVMILHRERFWRERLKFSIAIVSGVFALVLPWSAFVYTNSGKIIFLTDNTVVVNSLVNGVTFATRGEEYRKQLTLQPRSGQFMRSIETELASAIESRFQKQTAIRSLVQEKLNVGDVVDVIAKVTLDDRLGALYFFGYKSC